MQKEVKVFDCDDRKNDVNIETINGLTNYLVNVYIYKYPIADSKNKKYELLLGFLERTMTPRQVELLRCPYQKSDVIFKEEGYPLVLKIGIQNKYTFDFSPIFLEIDEKTGIVDDFSIMCLAEYYHGLRNNMTIEELADVFREQNLPIIDVSEVYEYISHRKELLKLRWDVIDTITERLLFSDNIFDNGHYRSRKFLEEFNAFYNLGISDEDIEKKIKYHHKKRIKNKSLTN